jgi:hypothetical protein
MDGADMKMKFFSFACNPAGMFASVAIHFHAEPVEEFCPIN